MFIRYVDFFNCMGFGRCGFNWSGKSFCAPVTAKKKTEVFYSESSVSSCIFTMPTF
jgi:hypothetical protein